MQTRLVLPLAVLCAPLCAQLTNVVPTSANGVAGSTVNAFPWGTAATAWPGLRIMCVYDSTNFTTAPLPITAPILITNVRWRANDVASSWTGGTYNQATLSLGTAAVDHLSASTTWASNTGPDYTQVYSGPVTVLPGTGNGVGVPGPYVVDIPVNPPFLYDPAAGDLIVDTDYLGGSWGGGTFSGMDVTTVNVLARRVYSSSMYPNANGVDANAPVIEVGFLPSGPGTFATNTTVGLGCVRQFTSLYETFPTPAAFDLANTAISWVPVGGSYLVLPGLSTYVPPSPTATTLTLANDAETSVALSGTFPFPGGTTTSLTVCSNGYVSVASGNGTGSAPSPLTMLNAPRTAWWNWHDYNPAIAGSGPVRFEQIGTTAYVTFDGVWDAGGTSATNASTFQFQFDVGSGFVHLVIGATSTLGNGRLVGYSPGGNSADPGNTDLSAALAGTITLATNDVLPLVLAGGTRPLINTTWTLNVANVPASGTVGIDIFGLSNPNVADLGFLGAPGCGARASLDLLSAWIVAGSTHSYSLALPNSPALVNFHVFTQSAVLQPGVNTLLGGIITSNGIDGRIGDL
jgi:hypothetical protein